MKTMAVEKTMEKVKDVGMER